MPKKLLPIYAINDNTWMVYTASPSFDTVSKPEYLYLINRFHCKTLKNRRAQNADTNLTMLFVSNLAGENLNIEVLYLVHDRNIAKDIDQVTDELFKYCFHLKKVDLVWGLVPKAINGEVNMWVENICEVEMSLVKLKNSLVFGIFNKMNKLDEFDYTTGVFRADYDEIIPEQHQYIAHENS